MADVVFGSRLLSPRPSLLNTASDARLNSSPQKPLDLKQLKQRAAAIPPIVSTLLERAGTGSTACASCTFSRWALWCAQGCKDVLIPGDGLWSTESRAWAVRAPGQARCSPCRVCSQLLEQLCQQHLDVSGALLSENRGRSGQKKLLTAT